MRRSVPLFFFSSRRRHTRWPRDWSSDVCSSDLPAVERLLEEHAIDLGAQVRRGCAVADFEQDRSEERRVGKECRSRGGPEQEKERRTRRGEEEGEEGSERKVRKKEGRDTSERRA